MKRKPATREINAGLSKSESNKVGGSGGPGQNNNRNEMGLQSLLVSPETFPLITASVSMISISCSDWFLKLRNFTLDSLSSVKYK